LPLQLPATRKTEARTRAVLEEKTWRMVASRAAGYRGQGFDVE
jgi:hypothetical protein